MLLAGLPVGAVSATIRRTDVGIRTPVTEVSEDPAGEHGTAHAVFWFYSFWSTGRRRIMRNWLLVPKYVSAVASNPEVCLRNGAMVLFVSGMP